MKKNEKKVYEIDVKNYVLKERDVTYCGMEIFSIKKGHFDDRHRFVKRNPVFVIERNEKGRKN